MGIISLQVPTIGQPDTTEDVKVQNNFTTLQTVINGNIDTTNLTAAVSQSAGINASGQTVKGAVSTATSQSTGSTTFTTLTTPDQVTGVVLPTNGLIQVWYQATWQQTVAGAAQAAIFVGANQMKVAFGSAGTTTVQAALIQTPTNANMSLSTFSHGLISTGNGSDAAYAGDVTTGQAVGIFTAAQPEVQLGVSPVLIENTGTWMHGGPCTIFAAAGTYTVSVQFKASSGTVTASNRKLWVQALSFA